MSMSLFHERICIRERAGHNNKGILASRHQGEPSKKNRPISFNMQKGFRDVMRVPVPCDNPVGSAVRYGEMCWRFYPNAVPARERVFTPLLLPNVLPLHILWIHFSSFHVYRCLDDNSPNSVTRPQPSAV